MRFFSSPIYFNLLVATFGKLRIISIRDLVSVMFTPNDDKSLTTFFTFDLG